MLPSTLNLFCYGGCRQLPSIDPNALAIISLLHWHEVEFTVTYCIRTRNSPTGSLPCINLNGSLASGYNSIIQLLMEESVIPREEACSNLVLKNFLIDANQSLLDHELFQNVQVFSKFTEAIILSSSGNFYWNYLCSRVFPLNHENKPNQMALISDDKLRKSLIRSSQEASLEIQILLWSNLRLRSCLDTKHVITELNEFQENISKELLERKLKMMLKTQNGINYSQPPPLSEQSDNAASASQTSILTIPSANIYSGLFSALMAIALFYTIKNRGQ